MMGRFNQNPDTVASGRWPMRAMCGSALFLLWLLQPVTLLADEPDWQMETVATGLEHPWSLAFLPDGRMLVTERAGRLRLIGPDDALSAPIQGVPQAHVARQGGLLDVVVDPDFADNGRLYLSFAHRNQAGNTLRVVRARLDGETLQDVEPIFTAQPRRGTPVHYGGRMLLLDDGTLLVSVGDAFNLRDEAQNPANHLGSLVRIRTDGRTPADNPFVDHPEAAPEIFSYGHRNVQGLALDRDRDLIWSNEHGPRGGDELNRIEPGGNHGWPLATHGVDYTGAVISPHRELPGMVSPIHVWTPAIAPAGLLYYTGDAFPGWRGSLFNAGLVSRDVRRIVLGEAGEVTGESSVFGEVDARVRDVRQGPEGEIFLLTDEPEGRVIRIVPASSE